MDILNWSIFHIWRDNMADALYMVEKQCPACEKMFSVTRVRTRLTMIKKDSDFCTYYHGVNPYYYHVWVCPHCGYAVPESDFEKPPSEKVVTFLHGRKVHIDFSGIRTREQAINTYKLAIFYAEMTGIYASKIAGLYLRLGWIYREGELKEEEQLALSKAIEFYDKAMASENFPIGNMTEPMLMYLYADLLRRTGKIDEALVFYNRVISNPQSKLDPRILNLARSSWQEAREEKRAAEEEKESQEETVQKNP
jgi:uncharacterized protein (DUF2225 family)